MAVVPHRHVAAWPPRDMPWGRAIIVIAASIAGHLLLLERLGGGVDLADPARDAAPVVAARLIEPSAPPRAIAPPAAPKKASAPRRPARQVRPASVPTPAPASAAPAQEPAPLGPNAAWIVDGIAPDLQAPDGSEGAVASRDDAPPAESARTAEATTQSVESANAEKALPTPAPIDPDAPFVATGAALVDEIARNGAAVQLPSTARYVYATSYSELSLSGVTTIDWQREAMTSYKLRMVTRALGFDLIELNSSGRLEPFGLAPDRYVETRTRRAPQAANFDWAGARVSFSARNRERVLVAGMQDRLSFQFQLMWLAQALPQRVSQDAKMVLPIAGRDDVAIYQFRFAGRQKLDTGLGEIETIKIERLIDHATEARVDVWLAPDLGWLPVKLRFTDRHQRVTESLLQSMESAP